MKIIPLPNPERDPAKIWNDRYRQHGRMATDDRWLDRWRSHLPSNGQALNLGCGDGVDTRVLCDWHYHTLSVDLSPEALKLTHQIAPESPRLRIDIRDGLPFLAHIFDLIVASLSLHYFNAQITQNIIDDIHRCLKPGAHFIARFNSINDVNHGAQGHPEIEPGLCLVDGQQKRFFNRQSTTTLFQRGWIIHNIEELTIHRYSRPKVVWEVLAISRK